jgi:hypothetical protein
LPWLQGKCSATPSWIRFDWPLFILYFPWLLIMVVLCTNKVLWRNPIQN